MVFVAFAVFQLPLACGWPGIPLVLLLAVCLGMSGGYDTRDWVF